ncbi:MULTISPECIES: signal peptidase I [unclassified Enterococcus]|uniref:signal peptidase I n=1 Tax=unclassified Enterococcus TaxID=2608891 RepID=UPI0013ED93E9|nr:MULTISPECIES: signal peptidase I [unclassified Enterococcus]
MGKRKVGNIIQINRYLFWYVLAVLVLGGRFFFVHPVKVEGRSMQPTLSPGSRAFVLKQGYTIDYGDIVTFTAGERNYIKRVIGLPGDELCFSRNLVTINGKAVSESYLIAYPESADFLGERTEKNIIIPENHFFVLGDNRLNSRDSREFGPIAMEQLTGKLWFAYLLQYF